MTVRKRGNKWQARFRWYDSDHELHEEAHSERLKADAEKWLIDRQMEHKQGRDKKSTSFLWLFDHYYNLYKVRKIRPNTKQAYELARRHFKDFFGEDRSIRSITPDDYQEFINKFGDTHSKKTVASVNEKISWVFRLAISNGYLIHNPAENIEVVGKDARHIQYLNLDQIHKIIEFIENTQFAFRSGKKVEIGTPYMVLAAIYTGARLSELAGLTWDDIDETNETVYIHQQYATRPNEPLKFSPLKTKASKRKIVIPKKLIIILKGIKDDNDEFVFHTQQNNPVNAQAVNLELHSIMDRAGVEAENFHFHSLRHSHVALLLSKGVDIYAISQRLGHSNFDTTLRTYAYLLNEQKEKENNKIKKALSELL
ncbi:tyrosine-type recombinase/integrase [Limosilactobacillus oris]|uniref:tyrosine-type recombinase/integrase n=1 Tax=Limosilactobacillus oris TaxID=1632 RepID=UPI003207F7D6